MAVVSIVRKDELECISSVEIDGEVHFLGALWDFRTSSKLNEFLGDDVSLSWVKLEEGETLEPHRHPMRSMVIVLAGRVQVLGGSGLEAGAGDCVCIPPEALHGFHGLGPNGFEGLSVQFMGEGIYTDTERPLVAFEPHLASNFGRLLESTKRREDGFRRHQIFAVLRSLSGDVEGLDRFLLYFLCWSRAFQRALFLRDGMVTSEPFASIFRTHLGQELGHDAHLGELVQVRAGEEVWDAPLEAIGSWFVTQMLDGDDLERWTLFFLVVEASADVFYSETAGIDFGNAQDHFRLHRQSDEEHRAFGSEQVAASGVRVTQRHLVSAAHGWDMIDALFDRLATLTEQR